ncbi:Uncharacterized copper-binding protein, cupredoxin-like subfamily [Marinobacter mobilis]|uniref:Uncharacterized copper-binding protein, cupredoxin-like subfamily n=2 Tax=Marinobacter mobilis TaxID=488533 RepID=A0A1H2R535_9GAMM|nr:Uncharacterized copper-binding protein, cupredoxin-like subfamily [Marinobacter mobilis]
MTSMSLKVLVSAAVLSVSAGAYAAGSHSGGHHAGEGDHASDGHHSAGNIGRAGNPEDVTRTIDITMYDNYYEPEVIDVNQGETVRFRITNQGALVHEFNIGTAAMHRSHQAEMMMMVEHGVLKGDHIDHDMMNMDMGNGHTMKHDDPNSALLEPGQSAEVIWTFNEQANLEFACNVPGHYQAGMSGEFDI